MKELLIKTILFLQVDKIADKIENIINQARIRRIEKRIGQDIKYVNQGYNLPIITCARGNGKFSLEKGSHLKSDTYIDYMGG